MKEIKIFYSEDWAAYELLDTGGGEKLERFGQYKLIRPYEDAAWEKSGDWHSDAKFFTSKEKDKSGWEKKIERFILEYKGIKFYAEPTPFRHLGFFPEQAPQWDLIARTVLAKDRVKVKFLNLFGYTGVASLFALRAGAEVTHVDASGQSLDWAKANQNLNPNLKDAPMRVIEDDVIKFLEREVKRGNKYDAIVLDPPKFGRGPKGEVWKIEEQMPRLLGLVRQVLSDEPMLVILTSYATDSSSLTLGYALEEVMKDFKGEVSVGELCLKETSHGRLIPLANTAIWNV